MDYKVMSLTNPHTIRGTPTLKDVERFRDGNGSFHEFCRLKALVTLKEVNASDAKKRKNEQNFDDEIKNNKQIAVNSTLLFNSMIRFLFL